LQPNGRACVVQKCIDGGMTLNDDPEKHKGKPYTDENCFIARGLIREDERVKFMKLLK
jgi:hypothetical protein